MKLPTHWLLGVIGLLLLAYLAEIAVVSSTNTDLAHPDRKTAREDVGPKLALSNNVVTLNGWMIGSLSGTNFVPIPDVSALSSSFENGFAVGVRYGAIAARRNPDVNDAGGLTAIARELMQQEQQAQAAQQQRTRGK